MSTTTLTVRLVVSHDVEISGVQIGVSLVKALTNQTLFTSTDGSRIAIADVTVTG